MNYQRVREEAKKKIQAKKLELSKMSGQDRTKLEQHLVGEAEKEELARLKEENAKLKSDIEKSDKEALELLEKNEELEAKLAESNKPAEDVKPAEEVKPQQNKNSNTNTHKKRN